MVKMENTSSNNNTDTQIGSFVTPLDAKERHKRRREGIAIIVLAVLFVLLFVAEFYLTRVSSSLPFVNSIFFFGLLNLNIFLLIALVWLIFRNIGKVFIERRRKVLGARLKTKLIIVFLSFSIIPTLVLFLISSMYINSSFDKWFSIKIQNTLQASLEITRTYYKNTSQNAVHFAEHLAFQIGKTLYNHKEKVLISPPKWVKEYITSQRELLALDFVEFYNDALDERVLARRSLDELGTIQSGKKITLETLIYPRLPLDLLDRAFSGETVSVIHHVGSGDLIRCLAPVYYSKSSSDLQNDLIVGVVAVAAYIPVSLVNKVDEIASVFDDYKDINPLKYPVKTAYFLILIMITLVIIFVAIWIGLYLARELTVPLERLVKAARAIGAGNLDVSIETGGHDEISVLIRSFNKMASDLKDNRERLLQTSTDLEKRRLQQEAVLSYAGTGVLAVDSTGEITTFNKAAGYILGLPSEAVMKHNFKLVLEEKYSPLVSLIERAYNVPSHHIGQERTTVLEQWNYRSGEETKNLAAVATPLQESENTWGVVVVIDDLTFLVKSQREVAWREVARRIAHEIKNPLTPIKLSAQRLQRRFRDYRGKDSDLLKICTNTIIQHSDELKEMVNEFSNFARLPEISPAPHDLNEVIKAVSVLFKEAHPKIEVELALEQRLQKFEFDHDQMKRVLINLFDNSVAALMSGGGKQTNKIKVETHYNESLQMAVIIMEDNGPGMAEEVKARVFEPYFSTKGEGTGLGLAIVKRIINDHDGFIRVQSSLGEGTQFIIEIPTSIRHGKTQ